MKIAKHSLSFDKQYTHQKQRIRQEEVLPEQAEPGMMGVSIELSEQSREALGFSRGRREAGQGLPSRQIVQASSNSQTRQEVSIGLEELVPVASKSIEEVDEAVEEESELALYAQLVRAILEKLFDKKIENIEPHDPSSRHDVETIELDTQAIRDSSAHVFKDIPGADESNNLVRVTEMSIENEIIRFQAKGEVQTAAGDTIDIDLSFAMSFEEKKISERITTEAALKDPLVINLENEFAELKEARFEFDIDSDGQTEELPSLGGGSHFLAWDRNDNQKIDNGKELFGAQSGNGFAELAVHDDDGNQFIDEGDEIYGKLMVWQPGGSLVSLAKVGVGAIYLQPVETPFENLGSDADGNNLGVLRSSSIFVKEDGGAGTVQQIDLRV